MVKDGEDWLELQTTNLKKMRLNFSNNRDMAPLRRSVGVEDNQFQQSGNHTR